jgi:amino acid permease
MKSYHSIAITNEAASPSDGNENDYDDDDDDAVPLANDHPRDHLSPPFDADDERPSNLLVGTFNLIATIVGGAALSLPIAFRRSGVAFATLVMILSACATYASLTMLCDSSRRGGGSSYGEVMRTAFGSKAEEGVSWVLFVFLAFVIVAYMVLIRDIWTPLVREALGTDDVDGDRVLLVITVVLLPFLFQRSLHALRWNCYVGSASIFVLCVALNLGGWQGRQRQRQIDDGGVFDDQDGSFDVEYFKMPSARDAMFTLPIIMLSFLCHFNIIAIQNALRRPTRERMRSLIRRAILACFALMYAFGLGGYYYAGSETQGNILLNVPTSRRHAGGGDGDGDDDDRAGEYYLFLLGRIGCGITLMLAMPMMALPCREALLEVVDVRFHRSHHANNDDVVASGITDDDDVIGGGATAGGGNEEEGSPCKLFRRCNKYETVRDASIATEDEVVEIAPESCSPLRRSSTVLIRRAPIQGDYVFRNSLAHYGSTLTIVVACYVGAVAVSGVAVVWSFIGSSAAFFISFVLPCGSFLVIENAVPTTADTAGVGDRPCGRVRLAWTMLLLSIVGAAVCTINSIRGFG